jgi:hypothetical protein
MNETLRQAAEQVISGTTGQVIDKAGEVLKQIQSEL